MVRKGKVCGRGWHREMMRERDDKGMTKKGGIRRNYKKTRGLKDDKEKNEKNRNKMR